MGLTIVDIILGVCFLTITILSFVLLLKGRSLSGRFLALTSLGSALWIAVSFVFYHMENGLLLFFAKMQYVSGAFVISCFLLFVIYFVGKNRKINDRVTNSIIAFFVAFTILILTTDYFIGSAAIWDGMKKMTYGPLYFSYIIYIFALLALSYYFLFREFKRSDEKFAKAQITYIAIGSFLSVSIAIFFDVIMPTFGKFHFLWIGPATTAFFIASTSYAVIRHSLFNIKMIATELFTFAILVTLFAQALSAENIQEFFYDIIFFAVVALLSVFLVKSVHKEISQRKEIERLAHRLSNFVSFTTHELRTPIGKFKSVLSMILEDQYGKVGEETKKILRRTYDVAIEMGQSVETFLCLNKLEINKLGLFKQKTDLNEIVSKSVNDLEEKAKNKNIKMALEKGADLPELFVDKFLINHVVNNLLSNAIKYTPEGGKVKIFTKKDEKESEVACVVEDNGIGMTRKDIASLFKQYKRGSEEAKISAEGSGVGLYLARKLVELHGGKIWAQSEGKNKGSLFIFTLPVLP